MRSAKPGSDPASLQGLTLANTPTIGIDEVGRGAWAGPMVICAALVPPEIEQQFRLVEHTQYRIWHLNEVRVGDSKKLSSHHRQISHDWLIANIQYAIAEVSVQTIHHLGLRKAWEKGVQEALGNLSIDFLPACPPSCRELVEGPGTSTSRCSAQPAKNNPTISKSTTIIDGTWLVPNIPVQAIPKADAHHFSVAAASIIAKHHRDTHMQQLHHQYPHYSWDTNVGYGTQAHQTGILNHGISQHHRTLWVENWQKRRSQLGLL